MSQVYKMSIFLWLTINQFAHEAVQEKLHLLHTKKNIVPSMPSLLDRISQLPVQCGVSIWSTGQPKTRIVGFFFFKKWSGYWRIPNPAIHWQFTKHSRETATQKLSSYQADCPAQKFVFHFKKSCDTKLQNSPARSWLGAQKFQHSSSPLHD
jgi:hypothetical protein